MIKRALFIIAAAALSLTSCQKDDSLKSQDMGDVIGFSSYMERSLTRAQVTDITVASLDTFKVMAYLSGTSNNYFETEQKATKQISGTYNGQYTTGDTYFWPLLSGLDFFAYRGAAAGGITNTEGTASLTYTVPSAGTEDLVASAALNCTKAVASGDALSNAQQLTFCHVLTKVNSVILKAKEDGVNNTANFRFVVTDVRIDDADNTADYTFNPTSPATNWGSAGGSADYIFPGGTTTFVGTACDTLKSGGTNDQFIILPQTATFSITYSVQYSADGSTGWTEVMSSTAKSVTVQMEMGKSYDITFELSNETSPIIYSAGIGGWTPDEFQGEPGTL